MPKTKDPQLEAYNKARKFLESQKQAVLIKRRCPTSLGELQPGCVVRLPKAEVASLMKGRKVAPHTGHPKKTKRATKAPQKP